MGALVAAGSSSTAGLVLVLLTSLVVLVAFAVRERRRRRAGRPQQVPEHPSSWLAAAVLGVLAYGAVGTALAGALPPLLPVIVCLFATGASRSLWPRLRRRDEAVVLSVRPDGVLVRGAVDVDASLPLARWAKSAGVPMPVLLTLDLLLVGLPEGLELWVSERRGRPPQPVAVLPWDDVDVRRAPAPEPRPGWVAVLTLRGARPSDHAREVPRPRAAHEVALRLYAGASPALTVEAVDRLVASLEAQRPSRPLDAAGDVG